MIGTSLGPYQVVAKLGEGGMGEVYRARDTKLNRDVAIKVLPAAFALDADRLARFTREAQVLASLNHPNIAAIYGIEGTALVMELVEGEDLSQRIARLRAPGASARQAGMALDEALPIGRQIAEALEAAHEQGIVHRDLKPANVKVRPDGTVKVLDFGLAKAIDQTGGAGQAGGASRDLENSPTITTPAMTMRGMILGTAAYMPPEQAKGKAVDKRADIWAFGAVLYEMLTGARAFRGEGTTDTIVSVISKEPDWSLVPAAAPARLIQLLRRCLQKDAKVRLRDIGEARVELLTLISRAPEPAETMPTPVLSRRRSIAWLAAGVAIGAAAILLTAPWWRPAAPVSDHASVRFPLNWPEGVTPVELVASGSGGTLAVSPDGRAVVLMASSMAGTQLWLRLLEADHARPLAGTEGGAFPFWSPDSAAVAFFSQGGLKRIEIATGLVTTICTCATAPLANRSGTWGADNVIIFSGGVVGSSSVLYRVSALGGAPSPLTTLNTESGEGAHAYPRFLPDGRRYLFAVTGAQSAGVYAGAIDSSLRTLVLELRSTMFFSAFAYAPSGHLLYVTDHRLVAHPFDQTSLRFTGEPLPIAEGFEAGGPGQPPYAVSDTGVLVFRPGGAYPQILPTWFSRAGVRLGAVGMPGPYSSVDLAPDGRTLAVGIRALEGQSIWTIDGERGTSSRLTSDRLSRSPLWFPTGDRVAYVSERDSPPNPFVRTLAGVETRLLQRFANWQVQSVSPDGRWLMVWSTSNLYLLSTAGDGTLEPFLETPFAKFGARIAPTGDHVAFHSFESGAMEVYVTTFPAAGRRMRVSTAGGTLPQWRGDGAELYFQRGLSIMAVAVTPAPSEPAGARLGLPQKLFDLPPGSVAWQPAKDGQRFLVSLQVADAVPAPTTVVLNWPAGLKK